MVRQSFVVGEIEMLEDITSRKYPSINHRWWSKKRRLPLRRIKMLIRDEGGCGEKKGTKWFHFAFCDLLWRNIFMARRTFHLTQDKKAEFFNLLHSMLKWIKIKRIYKLKLYSEHSAFICELISIASIKQRRKVAEKNFRDFKFISFTKNLLKDSSEPLLGKERLREINFLHFSSSLWFTYLPSKSATVKKAHVR